MVQKGEYVYTKILDQFNWDQFHALREKCYTTMDDEARREMYRVECGETLNPTETRRFIGLFIKDDSGERLAGAVLVERQADGCVFISPHIVLEGTDITASAFLAGKAFAEAHELGETFIAGRRLVPESDGEETLESLEYVPADTPVNAFTIRQLTEDDLRYFKTFAEKERQVCDEIDSISIKTSTFTFLYDGDRPVYDGDRLYGMFDDETLVCIARMHDTDCPFDTIRISDVFVATEYRGHDYGYDLVRAMLKEAVQCGYNSVICNLLDFLPGGQYRSHE